MFCVDHIARHDQFGKNVELSERHWHEEIANASDHGGLSQAEACHSIVSVNRAH